jgi:hypothetical protein
MLRLLFSVYSFSLIPPHSGFVMELVHELLFQVSGQFYAVWEQEPSRDHQGKLVSLLHATH